MINGLFMNVLALTFKCICAKTRAFNTCLHKNNVGCIHLYFVKSHTENHIKIETWPKSNLKWMETMLYFFILILLFESQTKIIISCHIFLLPRFTYMSNKLHLIKTLANPIHFWSFRNLFTSIHASWMTFNYNIYAHHAFNT